MRRFICRLLPIIICVLPAMPSSLAHIQATSAPLLLTLSFGMGGDIYSYSAGKLINLTNYGYNGAPVLSPDGKYVAYTSIPQTEIANPHSGATATNIWLMEVSTGKAKRIAEQPPYQPVKSPDGDYIPLIIRGDPVWSPDGKYIAWMEDEEAVGAVGVALKDPLELYTAATGETKDIYDQPVVEIGVEPIAWIPQGIGVLYAEQPGGPYSLRILDIQGQVKVEFPLGGDPSNGYAWLNAENSPTVITRDAVLTGPDGSRRPLSPVVTYSLSAPSGIRFVSDSGPTGTTWTLVVPGAAPIDMGNLWDLAISPDGTMAAYTTNLGADLFVFDGQHSTQVDLSTVKVRGNQPQVLGLAWSALGTKLQAAIPSSN